MFERATSTRKTVGTSPTSSPVVRITNQRLPRGPFGWPFAVPFAEPDPLLLAPALGALLQIEHRKPGLGSPRAATSDPGLCRSPRAVRGTWSPYTATRRAAQHETERHKKQYVKAYGALTKEAATPSIAGVFSSLPQRITRQAGGLPTVFRGNSPGRR